MIFCSTSPDRDGPEIRFSVRGIVPNVSGAGRENAARYIQELAEQSRKEAGNLRFDVVHQKARTNHFTVIEIWRNQKADDAHEIAAHTKEWRGVLTPLTGALYDQRWYKAL